MWLLEAEQPIVTSLPVDVQVERMFKYLYLAECNEAMARMYRYIYASDITGKRATDLFLVSEPANIAAARAFVEQGYKLNDVESAELDVHRQTKYFSNSLIGIVENNFLPEAWGRKSLGLLGMRERALMCGGNLNIESMPGIGTAVTAQIQVNPVESNDSQ